MFLDINSELKAFEESKANITKKLTSYFEGKWIACTITERWGNITKFLKNKDGKFVIFKVENCRPKAASINSNSLLNELLLEGHDSRGTFRTQTILRKGYIKRSMQTSELEVDKDIFEFDIDLFESEEEAELFASLQESLNPSSHLF